MIQNLVLVSGSNAIVIAGNNTSEFAKDLEAFFKKPRAVEPETVVGILNRFDKMEHEGVVSRSDLLNWLWERTQRFSEVVAEFR